MGRKAFVSFVGAILLAAAGWQILQPRPRPGVEPQHAPAASKNDTAPAGPARTAAQMTRTDSAPLADGTTPAPPPPPVQTRQAISAELAEQWRVEIARLYEDAGRDLNLTDSETDTLLALLLDQRIRYAESGLGTSIEAVAARKELDAEHWQEIETLLGADRARGLATYRRSLQVRYEVENLRKKLGNETLALTEAQRKQLIRRGIERGAYASPTVLTGAESDVAYTQEQFAKNELAYQRLMEAARGVLTPEQFARIEELWTVERESTEHYLRQLEQEQRRR